jgi:type I restriction enzyme S subunit
LPWIGSVPKHWEIYPLKYVVKWNQHSLSSLTPPEYEIEYIDIGNVTDRGSIIAKQVLTFGDAPSRARRLVKNGDIIISTVRTYLRAVAFIENPSPNTVVSTGFAVIACGPKIFPRFAYYQLQSHAFIEQVVGQSVGVSYPAIAPSKIGRLPFLVPPLPEQMEIADKLDRAVSIIDQTLDTLGDEQSSNATYDTETEE